MYIMAVGLVRYVPNRVSVRKTLWDTLKLCVVNIETFYGEQDRDAFIAASSQK